MKLSDTTVCTKPLNLEDVTLLYQKRILDFYCHDSGGSSLHYIPRLRRFFYYLIFQIYLLYLLL